MPERGLKAAMADFLPRASWQRCTVHVMRNVLDKVPQTRRSEVAAALKTIWHQENADEARHKAQRVIEQYRKSLPAAMRTLEGALEDSLTFYRFPREHWKMLRTNNPLERLMKEIRRRTKVAEQFPHEESALLLVTARLKRIHEGWAERRYLDHGPAPRTGAVPNDSGGGRLSRVQPHYRIAFTHNPLRFPGRGRRFILVQLPEPLDSNDRGHKGAVNFCDKIGVSHTIAELTKERLRRAGGKIRAENPEFQGDLGFRVFKLDSSNIRPWEPDRDDLEGTLLEHAEHLVPGRTEQDVLYELLLKLGLDLCVPIERKVIAGKTVHSIGGGVLLACLAEQIGREEAEPLAEGIASWHQELAPVGDSTCVFRDSAFEDDVAKSNLAAILQQHGIENVRSL